MASTCGATTRDGAPCKQPAGWGTDHVGEGRCRFHGGATPTGEDSPHFKHGLFSDYLGEEDRETVEALEGVDSADKLEDVINWRLARLRRAVRHLNDANEDADAENFWEAFAQLVNKTQAPEAAEIRELAELLDSGNRAMQREVDIVRKCIKDLHRITEGQTVTHEGPGITIHTEADDGGG